MATSENTPRELALLALANRQHGVLRDSDLRGGGLSRWAIDERARSGRLDRLHEGVYAWGHRALTREGFWLAALWACGEGVVLSHRTAAAVHAMGPETGPEVHLSTTRSIHDRPGIVVHRVRTLDRLDWQRVRGLPVTRVARTIIDLADEAPWEDVRAAVDTLRRFQPGALQTAQARAPGRRGRGKVTRLLEADQAHTKSEFERRFLRFLRRNGLPLPDGVNDWVAGCKADCRYADERLVVELDGRSHHRRRGQMATDRRRDEAYQLAGHRILRLLWDDLHPENEAATAERLLRMLGR